MAQDDPWGGWKPWRIRRLIDFIDLRSQGLTYTEIADRTPWSEATVKRELYSPQAVRLGELELAEVRRLVAPLLRRHIAQIESDDLKPVTRLNYRDRLIEKLLPRPIMVRGQIEHGGEVSIPELDAGEFLSKATAAVVSNFMESEAKRLREEDAAADGGPLEGVGEGLDTGKTAPGNR